MAEVGEQGVRMSLGICGASEGQIDAIIDEGFGGMNDLLILEEKDITEMMSNLTKLPHHKASLLRRFWPFLYSPTKQILFQWQSSSYLPLHPTRFRLFNPISNELTMDLPDDSSPIDAFHTTDGWRISQPTKINTSNDDPDDFPTFKDYLSTLPDHERCPILRFTFLVSNVYEFVHTICNFDDFILVSDGGAKDDYGSYGWVISHTNGTRIANGHGSVFVLNPKSYHAEISGCNAALLFILHAFQFCQQPLPPGILQIYCDNEGFVKKINKFREFRISAESCCLHSEWDILISVHRLCHRFPSPPSITHLLGHQDRQNDFDDLSLPSQLNVEADALATLELEEYSSPKPIVPFNPASLALLHIDNCTVTRNIDSIVHQHLFLPPLQTYYMA
jgi:hypothetical protein